MHHQAMPVQPFEPRTERTCISPCSCTCVCAHMQWYQQALQVHCHQLGIRTRQLRPHAIISPGTARDIVPAGITCAVVPSGTSRTTTSEDNPVQEHPHSRQTPCIMKNPRNLHCCNGLYDRTILIFASNPICEGLTGCLSCYQTSKELVEKRSLEKNCCLQCVALVKCVTL